MDYAYGATAEEQILPYILKNSNLIEFVEKSQVFWKDQ